MLLAFDNQLQNHGNTATQWIYHLCQTKPRTWILFWHHLQRPHNLFAVSTKLVLKKSISETKQQSIPNYFALYLKAVIVNISAPTLNKMNWRNSCSTSVIPINPQKDVQRDEKHLDKILLHFKSPHIWMYVLYFNNINNITFLFSWHCFVLKLWYQNTSMSSADDSIQNSFTFFFSKI